MRLCRCVAMLFLLMAVLLFTFTSPACAASGRDYSKFVERRTAVCWVEGMVFDDLVMNARGKLTFLFVDAKMGAGLQKIASSESDGETDTEIARIVMRYAGNYGRKKDHALFAVYVESSKPWTFDTGQIRIGDYSPPPENVIKNVSGNPQAEITPGENELPTGYRGLVSFYVPLEQVKPGAAIQIGYGEDLVDWKSPGKNE